MKNVLFRGKETPFTGKMGIARMVGTYGIGNVMNADDINRVSSKASLAAIWKGLLFAAGCGAIVGYWRFDNGLFPGVQGILVGLITGTFAGYVAGGGAQHWRFGYRSSASLLLVAVFVFFELIGLGLAMPQFAPWLWVIQTLDGEHIDLVIGPSRASGFPFRVRQVEPVAWILFNALDLAFQSFLTLLSLGIRLNSRRK
ncbi:MAG: hypothetical protein IPJ30_09580 [Acidobacteria bacterium]|nr:hypothetical protein [Acidobacteriota bacterium]